MAVMAAGLPSELFGEVSESRRSDEGQRKASSHELDSTGALGTISRSHVEQGHLHS